MNNTIGIDFGTTKTLVAAVDQDGSAQLVHLGRDGDKLPTTIYVDPDRQFLFGEDADDQLAFDRGGYIRRVKRDLGKTDRTHVLNGHQFKPVELVSEFLRYVRKRVEEEHFHGVVNHAVVTVPAKYGPAARRDLETAAMAAGFKSVELLDEPIAAGIAFLEEKRGTGLGNEILVFDWGGGTLDIALVEFRNDEWNVNPDLLEGDKQLGGEDIDDRLVDVINAFLVGKGVSPIEPINTTDFPLLNRRVEEMKRLLSLPNKEKHSFTHKTANWNFTFPCSRTELEMHISEELDRAFQCLTSWENRARVAGKSIDKVLLVGGTSQIPAVERRLAKSEKRPLKWTRGLQAVALGAAIHAHKKVQRSAPEENEIFQYRTYLQSQNFGLSPTEKQYSEILKMRKQLGVSQTEADIAETQIYGKSIQSERDKIRKEAKAKTETEGKQNEKKKTQRFTKDNVNATAGGQGSSPEENEFVAYRRYLNNQKFGSTLNEMQRAEILNIRKHFGISVTEAGIVETQVFGKALLTPTTNNGNGPLAPDPSPVPARPTNKEWKIIIGIASLIFLWAFFLLVAIPTFGISLVPAGIATWKLLEWMSNDSSF